MGRLPPLTIAMAVVLAIFGCEDGATKAAAKAASRERSEVVAATGTAEVKKTAPPIASAPSSPAPVHLRRVCDGQLAKPARDVPKKAISRKAAPGAKMPAVALPSGKWVWINLWAAWCGPCKEEMPRLARFSSRLAEAGKDVALTFISLDDDERQLEQFLAAAAPDQTRATYWLKEGRERDEWLAAVGLPKAPDLPVQLLVDPRGKIRCTVHGAIEDGDYAEILSTVSLP